MLPLPDGVSHVVTFAEYARVGGELEVARADRDLWRWRSEELREEFEFRRNALCDSLAAATATLDALREVVPENAGAWCEECCACVPLDECLDCAVCGEMPDNDTHATWFMNKLQAILYPATPKETPDAAANAHHGLTGE